MSLSLSGHVHIEKLCDNLIYFQVGSSNSTCEWNKGVTATVLLETLA